MQKLKPYTPYIIIIGLVFLLSAVSQFSQGNIAWADGTKLQTVPTRTPTPNPSDDDSSDGSGNGSSGDNLSKIVGVVTDLSTGKPGAGITVRLNDIEVKTDGAGKYSLSGLYAGQFIVSLALTGKARPAQEPITVTVDGRQEMVVDLTYYSQPSVVGQVATDLAQTDQADNRLSSVGEGGLADLPQQADAPQTLPQTGTQRIAWWLFIGFGFGLLWIGRKIRCQEASR